MISLDLKRSRIQFTKYPKPEFLLTYNTNLEIIWVSLKPWSLFHKICITWSLFNIVCITPGVTGDPCLGCIAVAVLHYIPRNSRKNEGVNFKQGFDPPNLIRFSSAFFSEKLRSKFYDFNRICMPRTRMQEICTKTFLVKNVQKCTFRLEVFDQIFLASLV